MAVHESHAENFTLSPVSSIVTLHQFRVDRGQSFPLTNLRPENVPCSPKTSKGSMGGDWPGIAGPRHFCTRIPRLMAVVKPWIQCLPARLLNNS
jgi:hypothetical protein